MGASVVRQGRFFLKEDAMMMHSNLERSVPKAKLALIVSWWNRGKPSLNTGP
jgi:hypothetical protein